jgi:lysophospholipase L1-like esterase
VVLIITFLSFSSARTNKPDLTIILMTPPPFDAPAWDENKPLPESGSRSNDAAREYGERVKLVGKNHNCHVLDVFELLGGNGNDYGQYLSDGLHLNGSGNTKLYEGLMELIQRELPHLAPEEIPMEEKLWTDLC